MGLGKTVVVISLVASSSVSSGGSSSSARSEPPSVTAGLATSKTDADMRLRRLMDLRCSSSSCSSSPPSTSTDSANSSSSSVSVLDAEPTLLPTMGETSDKQRALTARDSAASSQAPLSRGNIDNNGDDDDGGDSATASMSTPLASGTNTKHNDCSNGVFPLASRTKTSSVESFPTADLHSIACICGMPYLEPLSPEDQAALFHGFDAVMKRVKRKRDTADAALSPPPEPLPAVKRRGSSSSGGGTRKLKEGWEAVPIDAEKRADDLQWLMCGVCKRWQHELCAFQPTPAVPAAAAQPTPISHTAASSAASSDGDARNSRNSRFICCECEAAAFAGVPLHSHATLIVVPQQLRSQWGSEIELHTWPGTIRVANYAGVKETLATMRKCAEAAQRITVALARGGVRSSISASSSSSLSSSVRRRNSSVMRKLDDGGDDGLDDDPNFTSSASSSPLRVLRLRRVCATQAVNYGSFRDNGFSSSSSARDSAMVEQQQQQQPPLPLPAECSCPGPCGYTIVHPLLSADAAAAEATSVDAVSGTDRVVAVAGAASLSPSLRPSDDEVAQLSTILKRVFPLRNNRQQMSSGPSASPTQRSSSSRSDELTHALREVTALSARVSGVLWPRYLASRDVVITTYAALQNDVYHADNSTADIQAAGSNIGQSDEARRLRRRARVSATVRSIYVLLTSQ